MKKEDFVAEVDKLVCAYPSLLLNGNKIIWICENVDFTLTIKKTIRHIHSKALGINKNCVRYSSGLKMLKNFLSTTSDFEMLT